MISLRSHPNSPHPSLSQLPLGPNLFKEPRNQFQEVDSARLGMDISGPLKRFTNSGSGVQTPCVRIVINSVYPKVGAWEGAERLLAQLAALALLINIFLLPPVLFIEYTQDPLCFERELKFPLLCTQCRLLSWVGVQTPEPTVIKPFHPKEGAFWEGSEKVLSSCSINLPNLLQL